MPRGFIVSGNGGDQRRVPVGSLLLIGRAGSCGLVIRDRLASREHVEIQLCDDSFVCRDLGSSNGTTLNGKPLTRCELKHGDRLRLGETELRFEVEKDAPGAADGRTMFLQTVLDPDGSERELPPSSRSHELLEAAYTLMNALASNFNPCDLVDRVLRTTMDAMHAQRGAVLFAGADGDLRPCSECGRVHTIRNGKADSAEVSDIEISESVARRVLKDGENLLYHGGITDSPWNQSHSIQALKLSSVLCVPIRTQHSILGILYVDSDLTEHSYTQDDMLLAAAAGNSAGLALENARNHRALMEKERIDRDILAAGTIQEGFLIKEWPDDDRRFEVFGETRPAKTVGGDFYDFVRLDHDTVGIFVGDVSGKGVPAALTMALLLAEFRGAALRADSPAKLIAELNEGFVNRSRRGTFCTICYVTLDLKTGKVVGANAGHHPLVVVSGEGARTRIEASGPPVGVIPGDLWTNAEASMAAGESLVLYTDGIVEARAATTQMSLEAEIVEYELDNLRTLLVEHADAAPSTLVEAVLEDVLQYCAPLPPHDDCTMIALRYLGGE